jgi:Ca2+-binding RTX toxin-like protein
VIGSAFDDTVYGQNDRDDNFDGGSGNDQFFGFSGNDTMIGGSGNDNFDGGTGFDTIDYSTAEASVEVNFAWAVAVGDGMDRLTNVEGAIGSAFNDRLYGQNSTDDHLEGRGGDDQLWGFSGNDVLIGGTGNDWLAGGYGSNTLTGGDGSDTFVILAQTPNDPTVNNITDFNILEDRIEWEGTDLPAGTPVGVFRIGSTALEANDRIIYDSETGALFFDPDGSGSAAAQQAATLAPGLALTDLNFLIA